MRSGLRFKTMGGAIEMDSHDLATAALVKNFDHAIEGTLRLYNLKGIHFKPQTHLTLVDVKITIPIP